LTGVLLTYERQLLNWSATSQYVSENDQQNRMTLDELNKIAQSHDENFKPNSLTIANDLGAPVTFRAGHLAVGIFTQ